MGWVTRTKKVALPDGGYKYVPYQVWVDDPATVPPKNSTVATAAATAASAQYLTDAARRRAAALAATRRLTANAARQAAELYRQRQLRVKRAGTAPAPNPITPEAQKLAADARRRRLQVAERGTANLTVNPAYTALVAAKAALERAKKHPDDYEAFQEFEKYVNAARKRQLESRGTSLDRELILEWANTYYAHGQKVKQDFEKSVNEYASHFELNPDGSLKKPKDEAEFAKAQKLYNSPEFQRILSEYDRLYGDGEKQGSFSAALGTFDEISKSQRQYLYEIAKQKLFDSSRRFSLFGEKESVADIFKRWEGGEKFLYDVTVQNIDPNSTSMKWVRVGNRPPKLVHRTPQEEFEYRKEQYVTELKREYREWQRAQTAYRLGEQLSGPVNARKKADHEFLAGVMQEQGFGKDLSRITTNEQLQSVVNAAMAKWERENKKLFAGGGGGGRTFDTAGWTKARDEAKARFYATFGAEVPGLLEEVLSIPGVTPFLTQLGVPFAAIGAASKYLATLASGTSFTLEQFPPEQRASLTAEINRLANDPETQAQARRQLQFARQTADPARFEQMVKNTAYEIAKAQVVSDANAANRRPAEFIASQGNVSLSSFPAEQQALLRAEANRILAERAPKVKLGGLSEREKKTAFDLAMHRAIETVGRNWLNNTEEGRKWRDSRNLLPGGLGITTGRNSKEQERIFNEIKAFNESFNAKGSDYFSNSQALVQYGSQPFTPDSIAANLVSGIAFDPLVALPLKATTWLKRVEYAIDSTKDVNGLRRLLTAPAKFLKVTEAELRAQKSLKSVVDKLKLGQDPELILREVDDAIAGLTSKSARDRAIELLLREKGISKDVASEHNLFSLVEEYLDAKFTKAKIDYKTVRKQAADAKKQADELAKAAAEAQTPLGRVSARAAANEAAAKKVALAARRRTQARLKREAQGVKDAASGYKGLKVQAGAQLSGRGGREVGAQYVPGKNGAPGTIRVNDKVLTEQFNSRAWTSPPKLSDGSVAAALPADAFKNYREYKRFVLEHEYVHSTTSRSAGETLGAFETRINRIALHGESIGDKLVSKLPGRTQTHFLKDVKKAEQANKFIGEGGAGSSTAAYRQALGKSDTAFTADDVVFVSVNGNRSGRVAAVAGGNLTPAYKAVDDAIFARATILTDAPVDRFRSYNIGEREIADYLAAHGYAEAAPGRWVPADAVPGAAQAAPPPTAGTPVVDIISQNLADVRLAIKTAPVGWHVTVQGKLIDTVSALTSLGKMTSQQAADLAEMAKIVRLAPGGEQILQRVANIPGSDLFARRLAQILEYANKAAPPPQVFQSQRVTSLQEALRLLAGKTEEQWLMFEGEAAKRAYNRARSAKTKAKASARIVDVEKALTAIRVAKKGGPYIDYSSRSSFAHGVVRVGGDRAGAAVNRNSISPFVTSVEAISTERARALWRTLVSSSSKAADSKVVLGEDVSEIYAKHHVILDKLFDIKVPKRVLVKHGLPADLLDDITIAELLSNVDELEAALSNPAFSKFLDDLYQQLDVQLTRGARTKYTVQEYLEDRFRVHADGYDAAKYDADDRVMAEAIHKARGWTANTVTTLKRAQSGSPQPSSAATELIDRDIRVIIAKSRTAAKHGINIFQYNEARAVMRSPLVRASKGRQLFAEANKNASDALYKRGLTVDSKGWDEAFKKELHAEFIRLRDDLADAEGRKLLEDLASGEMYGKTPAEIVHEFEKRYGVDGQVRGFEPPELSEFQRKTLQNAVKHHGKIQNLDDLDEVHKALTKGDQRPPFENRFLMRKWLVERGFWSPREGKMIDDGTKSWSLEEERKFFQDNWAFVPDWADPVNYAPGGKFHAALHNETILQELAREQGIFSRNVDARIKTGKLSREERARMLVEGNDQLGLKPRRDLEAERKYVMDRFGDLAIDDQGRLKIYPWLMHQDELEEYILSQMGNTIAEGLPKSLRQLDILSDLIRKYSDKYFSEAVLAKKAATYDDLFVMASHVVHDLLADPVWLKRGIDTRGDILRIQAEVRRRLVFTNVGFMTTNVIDTAVKGPLTSFNTRAFRHGTASARARSLTPEHFGLQDVTQFVRDAKSIGTTRIKGYIHGEHSSLAQAFLGISELPLQVAANAELATKLRLAQGMYDGVLARFRKQLAKETGLAGKELDELADSAARKFVGEEVNRLWPTAGDGPIEKLFNELSPFMSYQFKNRILFIGELASHPVFYNYLNRIGDAIEADNKARWEREGRLAEIEERFWRQVELPWAPGVFIDLGQFSDAQRGLKPLYDIQRGGLTVRDFASKWLRLVSASDQNIVGGILNALEIPSHNEWVQILDVDGDPTGAWKQVAVPWEAPWGGEANALNAFWPVEAGTSLLKAANGNWNIEDTTLLFFQTMLFGGLRVNDKGAGLNSYYFALRQRDKEAAKRWLDGPDGMTLRSWWLEKSGGSKRFFTPDEIQDILNPPREDPNPWFHNRDEAYQKKVNADFDELQRIGQKWDRIIAELTPGTKAFSDAVLLAASERWAFYKSHPELYEYQIFSQTPEEWAKKLDTWHVDELTTAFYNIAYPSKDNYKSAADYQLARAEIDKAREMYLKMFPQVAERIGQTRDSIDAIWTRTEEGWFEVLDRIGTRSIAIEVARQAEDFDLLDQLYLANELDFKKLSADEAVFYFDKTTDFASLPKGVLGPPSLAADLLPRVKILPDFTKWRFDRLNEQEKALFVRENEYQKGMKEVIALAKASGNFGATFYAEMKKRPALLNQWFDKNPGKREQWAANDEYIKLIGKYGQLARAGKFAEAGRYFDSLPDWVKARYYEKHPERRKKMQENLRFSSYMEKWNAFYKRRDYAGGAAYFASLPKDVKERYYAGNASQSFTGSSPYAKAMGQWVKLLQDGKKEEARLYFASLPQAFKDRYYKKHPEAKIRNDIKRVGQLADYFATSDAGRAEYLKQNPEFAKWLKQNDTSDSQRRMLILAAYQSLPKGSEWLRRVFREQYPEIFSAEAAGVRSLKKTYSFLSQYPQYLPAFEKWIAAIWETYAENIKHTAARPKPIEADHSRSRRHGTKRKGHGHRGKSAEWVRIHSI